MLRGRGASERGSVAITVTLSLTLLLGFAALVVDIGLNWATRTSAQSAADSAALAGASTLLEDGGAAAVLTVETLLNTNVTNLIDPVADAGWATDGNEANGEIVCWLLTDPRPGPGAGCPDLANALQVITPPIQVNYAFAPVLGQQTNSIKATAAAGAGPAAPNNCALCLLEPTETSALQVLGAGGVEVNGGGIVVNSTDLAAVVALSTAGDVNAEQIRVVGGVDLARLDQLVPPAETGGPPVPDPLAHLLAPSLPVPPGPNPAPVITGDTTLSPGVYPGIDVPAGATLTLGEGVYVITEFPGFRVRDGGRVISTGDGAMIYLACEDYPEPCDGGGARFRVDATGLFEVDPPADGDYAGVSVFADRGNTTSMQVLGDVSLDGAVYLASAQLRVAPTAELQVNSLVVVDRLRVASLAPLEINYDPGLPVLGIEPPVLIR
jgi:Putative Flp pilus-assembly TadE/G-like